MQKLLLFITTLLIANCATAQIYNIKFAAQCEGATFDSKVLVADGESVTISNDKLLITLTPTAEENGVRINTHITRLQADEDSEVPTILQPTLIVKLNEAAEINNDKRYTLKVLATAAQ